MAVPPPAPSPAPAEVSSLRPACTTNTRAHTRIGNNGSVTHLKWEWLYYLAITLNLPWNTLLRNWAFIVHKKGTTINLLLQWGHEELEISHWNEMQREEEEEKGSCDTSDAPLKRCKGAPVCHGQTDIHRGRSGGRRRSRSPEQKRKLNKQANTQTKPANSKCWS